MKIIGNTLQKLLKRGEFPNELASLCDIDRKRHESVLNYFMEVRHRGLRLLPLFILLAGYFTSMSTVEKVLAVAMATILLVLTFFEPFSKRAKRLRWFEDNLEQLAEDLESWGPRPQREIYLMSRNEICEAAQYALIGYAKYILQEERRGAKDVALSREQFKEMFDLFKGYNLLGYNPVTGEPLVDYSFFFKEALNQLSVPSN